MSTTPSTTRLEQTLHRTNRALLATGLLRTAALAVAMQLAAGLGAVVVDALFGLNTLGLIAGNLVLAGLSVTAAALIVRTMWRGRFDARRMARYVEERADLRDSRLINAVDFADGRSDMATSPTLRAMAVSEGDRLAAGVVPGRLIDRRPAMRAMVVCAASLVVIVAAALVAPRLFAMVLPRYLDPTGDHPPFTLVEFDVSVSPDKVYHGRRAVIAAKLSGPIVPEEATVVFVDGAGDEAPAGEADASGERRLAMMQRSAGAFELPIERATRSRVFYIDTPHGRSKRHTLSVLPVPTFEKVTVRYEYPAYTGWPAAERPLDDAGIEAIVGTRVTVSIDSNLPLGMGFVTITPDSGGESDEATVNLAPASDRPTNVAGSFTLTHSGVYALSLRAADGTMSDASPTGPIRAIADAPPRVSLIEPDLRLIAPVGWKVRVSIGASDDIGVDRVTLHVLRGSAEPTDVNLDLTRRGPNRATGSHTIDLAELGAKDGDVIKGFATAYDNRPGVAQSADSPTFEIQVVSAEQYAEMAREQVRIEQINAEMQKLIAEMDQLDAARRKIAEQAEQLKKDLAEQTAAGDDGEPRQPGEQQKEDNAAKAAELAKQLEQYAKRAGDLAERMQERADREALYDFEEPVQEQYKQSASEMARQSAMAAKHGQGLTPPSQPTEPKLDALLRDLKRADDAAQSRQQEQQLTQQELAKLAKADAIMSAASAVMSIAEQQRSIADRLNAARAAPDALSPQQIDRTQRLADEQDALREQLDATLRDLADAAEAAEHELPKMSASADDLVRRIREELKVTGDQQQAADQARVQASGLAYMAAEAAATKLESLIGQCQGMCNSQAMDQLDGVLSLSRSQLSNSLSQMARARAGSGRRFGSGSGSGVGGQAGSQFGPGGSQPGGQASPNSGTLVGPHVAQRGRPSDRVGDSTSRSDAFNRADGFNPDPAASAAERLDAGSRTGDRLAPGDSDAAPLRYRPLIDAYFKRLADDSR